VEDRSRKNDGSREALAQLPLRPTRPTAEIRSIHDLVYAGPPLARQAVPILKMVCAPFLNNFDAVAENAVANSAETSVCVTYLPKQPGRLRLQPSMSSAQPWVVFVAPSKKQRLGAIQPYSAAGAGSNFPCRAPPSTSHPGCFFQIDVYFPIASASLGRLCLWF